MLIQSNVSYLYIINKIAHRSVARRRTSSFCIMRYETMLWLNIVLLFIQLLEKKRKTEETVKIQVDTTLEENTPSRNI